MELRLDYSKLTYEEKVLKIEPIFADEDSIKNSLIRNMYKQVWLISILTDFELIKNEDRTLNVGESYDLILKDKLWTKFTKLLGKKNIDELEGIIEIRRQEKMLELQSILGMNMILDKISILFEDIKSQVGDIMSIVNDPEKIELIKLMFLNSNNEAILNKASESVQDELAKARESGKK